MCLEGRENPWPIRQKEEMKCEKNGNEMIENPFNQIKFIVETT